MNALLYTLLLCIYRYISSLCAHERSIDSGSEDSAAEAKNSVDNMAGKEATYQPELENAILTILNDLQTQQQQKLSVSASHLINTLAKTSSQKSFVEKASQLLERDLHQAKSRADQLQHGLCAPEQAASTVWAHTSDSAAGDAETERTSPFFAARVSPPGSSHHAPPSSMAAKKALEEDY